MKQRRVTGAAMVFKGKGERRIERPRPIAPPIAARGKGDVLFSTRLARLARVLLDTLDDIAEAGAGFRSLGDARADTTTPHGRLMLTVLGGLAEFEA